VPPPPRGAERIDWRLVRALALFHARVGARLALLAAAPLAAAPVIGILLQQDPGAALRAAARWLAGAPADTAAGLVLAALGVVLASWAMQRIAVGQAGWLRHLPASDATQRRAALLAAATAQSSVVAGVCLLAPLAALDRGGIAFTRLFALPVMCVAAALAAWPARGSLRARALAVLSLALLAPARPAGIAAALPLLWLSDRLCGSLSRPASAARRRSSRLSSAPLIASRALGPGALLALLPALVPLAAMAALRLNNDLSPEVARGAARFGGGFGALLLLAGLADRLALRRPVWAWARSLPCSASRRVRDDALLLGACCVVPVAATAALDGTAALQVAGCLPLLAFHAASALHPRGARERSVGGEVLAAGSFRGARTAALAVAARPRRDAARRAPRRGARAVTEGEPVAGASPPQHR
jgi:hypothetical protein